MKSIKLVLAAAALFAGFTGVSQASFDRFSAEQIVEREASEGPRGADNERPGDRQRRGRGKVKAFESYDQLAREASEGPRGADNERPGDRQRGRGKVKAFESLEQVA